MSYIQQAPIGSEEEFTEIVVVRHGKNTWNAFNIVQGQLDPELNDEGRRQALAVALRLSGEANKPDAVYSSDLRRAVVTGEIIAGGCGVPTVVVNEALRDMHMGCLEGLTHQEARAQDVGGYDIYQITHGGDPVSRTQQIPGGGESLDQLKERFVSYLNEIAREHIGKRVVVVSHDAPIMELCRHTDDPNNYIVRKIPNASLNVFRVSGLTGEWDLVMFGDDSHLDGFPENSSGGDRASAEQA